MTEADIAFWITERKMLDTLYRERFKEWKLNQEAFDLKYPKDMRDLVRTEKILLSEFFPIVRQVIGTVAQNYHRLLFEITDDEAQGQDLETILERAGDRKSVV